MSDIERKIKEDISGGLQILSDPEAVIKDDGVVFTEDGELLVLTEQGRFVVGLVPFDKEDPVDHPVPSAMYKAQYKHDCKKCRFLGHFYGHDMYLCPQLSMGPTLLFRFGNEPSEYESYPYSIHRTVLTALSSDSKPTPEIILVIKRLTLARLLADAEGLKDAELLVSVTVTKR